ncbi:hypothetical protein CDV36_011987 [Fusarium kuroshium]|uniref:Oxidoreductase acuF-like C2H2 type zinc-finger domain-containing protein n=1 Tax=Fusarium kuroshium TaxID=2010991 RepID=A0A3M2RSX7_9HYPO|nr:hypothetical protein CDV36_011987 [Fusarium kuroshium]
MEETIESHVTRCLELFGNAVDAFKTSTDDPPAYFNRGVRDEQTRFKVWSGNIGAHRTGTGSLDHRLRDSSNIRKQVVSLLRDLSGLLEDAIALVTGQETPWDQLSDDEGVVLGEDAEDSDSPDTELEQISIDVTDVVNCLLRLSVAIRDPAPHDRFVASDVADTFHYEQLDIQHVCSKFGSIDSWLAERLGKANTRRRQFFKYREGNRMKASHDLGNAKTAVPSLPEHPKGELRVEDNCSDSGISQTSYASSTGDIEQRRVPPLPTQTSEAPFECPFCYMMIAVADESSWSHVGRHQEQLALFALPGLESNIESGSDDEEAWDVESMEARSDYSEMYRNEDAPKQNPPSTSSPRDIPPPPKSPNHGWQNKYFLPRDGIRPEVIKGHICHQLGSDALVTLGIYKRGQVTKGYYIKSNRILTSRECNDSNEACSRAGSDGTPFSPPRFSWDDQYSPDPANIVQYYPAPAQYYTDPAQYYTDPAQYYPNPDNDRVRITGHHDGPEDSALRVASFVREGHGDAVASHRSLEARGEELKKNKKKKDRARTAIEEFDNAYGSAS